MACSGLVEILFLITMMTLVMMTTTFICSVLLVKPRREFSVIHSCSQRQCKQVYEREMWKEPFREPDKWVFQSQARPSLGRTFKHTSPQPPLPVCGTNFKQNKNWQTLLRISLSRTRSSMPFLSVSACFLAASNSIKKKQKKKKKRAGLLV